MSALRFDISEPQRSALRKLLETATEAHVSLLPHDPEMANRLASDIRQVQENFGVEE
ncbi:MAG TPA: hypothetical protein VGF44_11350 [Terriglobales bacterium]|jgi:hypothetical protein